MKTNFQSIVITSIKANLHSKYENLFVKKVSFNNGFEFRGKIYKEVFIYSADSKSERDLTCINAFPNSFFEVLENGGETWHIVYDLDAEGLFFPYPSLKSYQRIPKDLEYLFKEVAKNQNI